MIRINGDVVVNRYVSIPQDLREGGLNTAAFVAGVVNGVLDAAEFVRRAARGGSGGGKETDGVRSVTLSGPRCQHTS